MLKSSGQFRQVLRRLIHAPRFTIVAVLALSAGVGANAAVFGVLNGVLLKPLPYPEPDRLVGVWHTAPGVNIPNVNMAPSNYVIYREQSTTFQDIGLYAGDVAGVTGSGEPEQVPGLYVTDGVLPMLGVTPAYGRLFARADGETKAPRTAMLGYAFWQKKFGGNPSIVGQTLTIDRDLHEVIGILPRDFHFLDREDPAVVRPLRFDRASLHLGQFSYDGLARLKPGVTLAQASADVNRMLPIVMRSFPAPEGFSLKMFSDAHIAANLRPLRNDVVGDIGGLLKLLMGCIAVVLLIACANVANLWLVRLEGRRREIGVRAALGAGRMQIAAELMLECLLLGGASAVAGLAIAFGALRGLVWLAPVGVPRLRDITIDVNTWLFTVGIALAASVLFGGLPIWRYAAAAPGAGMRDGGRSLSQSREQHRVRATLVVAQVALALVLLIGSGLMIRTFLAMTRADPGFNPSNAQVVRIYIPESTVKDPDQVIRTQETMRQKLQAIPGVSAVGVGTDVPMDGDGWHDPVFAQDRTYRDGDLPAVRRFKFVLPGYFGVVGTSMIAGRDITWPELEHHAPVAIVSRNLAVELWGTPADALGKRIRVGNADDWRDVIGVVADVYDAGVAQPAPSIVYWPMIQERFESDKINLRRNAAFTIRTTRAGSDALLKDVRQALWSIDKTLPIYGARTLEQNFRQSMARTSFTLILIGVAGVMALMLGVVGLYGVVAYSVSQRTHEVGIRMALGAQPDAVTRMFVHDGLRLTILGVICGVAGALAAVRLMASLLFHVSAMDPVTYALVSFGLVTTALIASYVPSRRAAATDPAIALRGD